MKFHQLDEMSPIPPAVWEYLCEQPLEFGQLNYNNASRNISNLSGLLATDTFYVEVLDENEQEAYATLDRIFISGMNRAHFDGSTAFADSLNAFQESDLDYYCAFRLINRFGTAEEQQELGFLTLLHEEIDEDGTDLTVEQRKLVYTTTAQVAKRVLANIAPKVDKASGVIVQRIEELLQAAGEGN